jgi:hypothetical protein
LRAIRPHPPLRPAFCPLHVPVFGDRPFYYAEDTLGLDLPESIRRLLAIPIKRHTRPILGFLTRAEIQTVLAAAGEDWTGRRDYLLFLLLYNNRVSTRRYPSSIL